MPSSTSCSSPPPEAVTPALTVIACGALASHIREIAARLALPIEVVPLPAALHNHPDRIAPAAERLAVSLRSPGRRGGPGYPDWRRYRALHQPSPHAASPPP